MDRDFGVSSVVAAKVAERRRALEEQYWPHIEELMRAAPQHVSVVARNPQRVSFDAKAAGAPEAALRTMRQHPQRAPNLAAEMLTIADPACRIQRLQTIWRTRGGQDPTD